MTVAVTAATGHLGGLAVEALLARGLPAPSVVAVARRPEALAGLAERGVVVRPGDYDDPASLRAAFEGVDRLLLVSGSELGRRTRQHTDAIAAAAAAGVGFVAYTSILRADTARLVLVGEHRETEQALAASGLPHALLRNGWYQENYTAQLPVHLEHGITGAARDGRVSGAARADYAEAAAAVLAGDGHEGAVYELGGEPFTMTELAEVVSRVTGRTVTYTDLPVGQYEAVLAAAGLPAPVSAMLADNDRGVAEGELLVDPGDLQKLVGRPLTTLEESVRAAVATLPA